MLNYEISKQPNKRFCPYPDCENVIEGKKHQLKTYCNECKRNFCF